MNPKKLELVSPSDSIHNVIADEVSAEELKTDFIQGVIDRMLEMSAGKGTSKADSRQMVGLAAVQLGVSRRIITIDTTADGSNKQQTLQVLVNPVISQHSKEVVSGREGCWSCSNVCGNVDRFKSVVIDAIDRNGETLHLELNDFIARIAQHEVDHLDATRFPERIPASEPERLHWVEPSEFDDYRKNWDNWSVICTRQRWEKIKTGKAD